MRLAFARVALASIIVTTVSTAALAGPALDDDKKASSAAMATDVTPTGPTEEAVEYGVGIRLRHVVLPTFMLNLFVARAADGAGNNGIGVDFTRRRGNLELQLGFEYEHVNVGQGVWIQSGQQVPKDDPDYVLSPDNAGNDLGWFTIEFTFLNHAPINKYMSFRYGGGLGLGIITGELDHYNIHCTGSPTNDAPEPGCTPARFGGQGIYTDDDGNPTPGNAQPTPSKYSLPPVFPVINAIIGLQFKPMEKWTINLETGIRTLPFIGIDSSYFF
jgi:hypothetical protein